MFAHSLYIWEASLTIIGIAKGDSPFSNQSRGACVYLVCSVTTTPLAPTAYGPVRSGLGSFLSLCGSAHEAGTHSPQPTAAALADNGRETVVAFYSRSTPPPAPIRSERQQPRFCGAGQDLFRTPPTTHGGLSSLAPWALRRPAGSAEAVSASDENPDPCSSRWTVVARPPAPGDERPLRPHSAQRLVSPQLGLHLPDSSGV